MEILSQNLRTEPLISKADVFHALDYEPKVQEVVDFHNSDAAVRIVSAPARTSKSYATHAEIAWWAMPRRPLCSSLHWVIGPTYDTNKEFQYLFEAFVERRERWTIGKARLEIEQAHNRPTHGMCVIVLNWGRNEKGHVCRSIIKGMSATAETALQGEEVTTATLSEAAEHPAHILSKYVSTRAWKVILPTTPKPQASWILDLVEQGEKDPELGIAHFHFPPEANPFYDRTRFEREERRAKMRAKSGRAEDDPYFAEQFLGRWVYYTGLALPFSESRHVLAEPPDGYQEWKSAISVDYGFNDPTSVGFWVISPEGLLVRISELYESRLDTGEVVRRTLARCNELGIEPSYCTGDPSRPEVARVFGDAGLHIFPMDKNAQRDRAAGHRRLVDLLTEGPFEGFPGLYVVAPGGGNPAFGCPQTIREWKHLRYKEGVRDEYGTTSLQGDDHAFDDSRAFVMTRPVPKSGVEEDDDWTKRLRSRRKFRGGFHGVGVKPHQRGGALAEFGRA